MRTKTRRNEDGNRMTSKSFDDDFDSKTRVATPPEEKEDASSGKRRRRRRRESCFERHEVPNDAIGNDFGSNSHGEEEEEEETRRRGKYRGVQKADATNVKEEEEEEEGPRTNEKENYAEEPIRMDVNIRQLASGCGVSTSTSGTVIARLAKEGEETERASRVEKKREENWSRGRVKRRD